MMEVEDLDVQKFGENTPTEETGFTQDEADFINSLDSGHVDNSADVGDSETEEFNAQAATGTAMLILNTIETIAKQTAHPSFKWQDAEKQATAEAVAPALMKNGGELPEWLEPYKEEVIALFAVGSLAFGGYMQVKALKELDEKNKKLDSDSCSDLKIEDDSIAA